jgi:O-antigen biosynthesis protein
MIRRVLGRSHQPPPSRFAEYLRLDGPALVGGPAPRHDPRLDDDPRLVVLLPHLRLDRMSGGPNTIFQVTARLLPLGIRIRYVATFGPLDPDAETVLAHLRRVTGIEPASGSVELVDASAPGAELRLGAGDVPFATWWPTAHVANAALDFVRAREFVYLVQDFEPGFYPWGTKHALAAATYAMPMRAIVNEPLLLEHLRAERAGRFGSFVPDLEVTSFMPAVDRTVFLARERSADAPRRLVFYARPRNPRNLFELGLRALREAVGQGVFDRDEWEFRAIGQELVDLPLSDRHLLRAMNWLPYDDYARLLGEADLLLSLMLSPHTSYPPLEMAVAGGLVVTNTFGVKTAKALTEISPAIRAAAPEVGGLVAAIREAVETIERRERPSAAAVLPGSWDEALAGVVPWLKQTVEELREG